MNAVRDPLKNFQETSTYKEAYDKVKNQKLKILHCYGIPGSGKSQLVRSLAKKFLYLEADVDENSSSSTMMQSDSLSIKWHVQCKDTGDSLKEEFKKLAEKLQENGVIDKASLKSLDEDFRKNYAKRFVNILLNCLVPVLILIEDPTDAERDILQNFFESLDDKFQVTKHSKFHIYLTSRSASSIVTNSFPTCHETLNVNGFNQEESINFLQGPNYTRTDTKEDFINVYKRFSGMPLGLLAAKSYCQQSGLSYKKYLLLADDSSYDILSKEKEAILQEYGQSQATEHVFQAIVMLFSGENSNSSGSTTSPINLHEKILCCIAYFHYYRIPRYLLDHCCHITREKQVKCPEIRNEADTGFLINKLLTYGMCTKEEDGAVTCHEVVLNAFRLKQLSAQAFNPLKKAIETICGLLSLDLRRTDNLERMQKLRPHLQALLHHIENNKEILEKDELLKAVTSHLYQVLAAALSSETQSEKINQTYLKSFKTIWSEMEYVIFPLQEKTPKEIADEVIETSKSKAENLSKDFPIKYASWIMISHFEEDEVEFLKSESKPKFEEIESLIRPFDSKTLLIEKLQEHGLFLSSNTFLPIFYAERFASIMHGWSRCFLYDDCEKSMKNCFWMNSLSQAISVGVNESLEIPLLTEWLSKISGLVPLLLKQKDQPKSLQEALKLCQSMIKNETLKMYENGLPKKAFSPPELTRISLLRYIVRINARLVKPSNDKDFFSVADGQCDQLYQLIENSIDHSLNRATFTIYCGKYYAARKKFNLASDCFKKFFQLSSKPKLIPKLNTKCWAVYNYVRSVRCAPSSQDRNDAIKRIKDVLKSKEDIQEDLKTCLEKELKKLEVLM